MKETEQTLLDQIKDQVAKDHGFPYGWYDCDLIEERDLWPIVCERYATAKAQASWPNKDKIGFIFGGKRYEFSRLAEPDKNKPEPQEYRIILEKFRQFITDQKDIEPEISKVIQAKLWEII